MIPARFGAPIALGCEFMRRRRTRSRSCHRLSLRRRQRNRHQLLSELGRHNSLSRRPRSK
ncbi:hypothetical protein A9K71_10155 [Mesorhizobium sp. WSM3873]|nr:hypothetical protein A9K71_10155 [Mesorhizobium sp. WSM3873]